MKLYFSPGACSQAPHILLHELGLRHDPVQVDLRAKTVASGESYLAINPKGSVPAVQLDNGEVLTENAVVLQYIADRSGSLEMLPSEGNFRRYRVLEWVNFITTELHKSFAPLFNPQSSEEVKQLFIAQIGKKFDFVEERLGDGPFLTGEELTIADPYLFVIAGWAEKMIGLDRWPNLRAFRERMMQRPAVRSVLRLEGLLEDETAG
jgi:glutathione S-transferase